MKDPKCRYFNKPCIAHECAHYVQLHGRDPQTGAPLSDWMCIDVAQLKATLDLSKQMRQVDGEINAFRNDVVAANVRAFDALSSRVLTHEQLNILEGRAHG